MCSSLLVTNGSIEGIIVGDLVTFPALPISFTRLLYFCCVNRGGSISYRDYFVVRSRGGEF